MQQLGMWFRGGLNSAGLIGLDNLRGLFQPALILDSMIYNQPRDYDEKMK